jgi:hypothetical protein
MEMPGETSATMPETYGLQEYFITDVVTEVIGHNVRLICGSKVGNHIDWKYSVVMPADRLFLATKICSLAACEAFTAIDLTAEVVRAIAH